MTISSVNGGLVNDGKWHHVVGVRNQTTQESGIYVDGKFISKETLSLPGGFSSSVSSGIGSRNASRNDGMGQGGYR